MSKLEQLKELLEQTCDILECVHFECKIVSKRKNLSDLHVVYTGFREEITIFDVNHYSDKVITYIVDFCTCFDLSQFLKRQINEIIVEPKIDKIQLFKLLSELADVCKNEHKVDIDDIIYDFLISKSE